MTTRPKGSSLNLIDIIGAVNTMDMGPVGSDITQAMVDTLQAGIPVCVGIGNWIISPITLPANSIIFGFGTKSVLVARANSNAAMLTLTNFCELASFRIEGNKGNQSVGGCHGIDVGAAQHFKLNDVDVYNTRGCGFYGVSSPANGRLNNCKVAGFTESGFKFTRAVRIMLDNPHAFFSDPAAIGDGISLTSDGGNVGYISIANPFILDIVGRGIAVVGSGARNAYDISIINPQITNTSSHGIHLMSTEAVNITGGDIYLAKGDGIRLEGDTRQCRVSNVMVKTSTGTGIREVINGTSPNENGFIYNVLRLNGSNAISITGVNSFIV